MRAMMIPALAALLMTGASAARPAAAYSGPWCAVYTTGPGTVHEKCDLPSFEACRAEAQFHGTSSFCRQSNYYLPYWRVAEPRPMHVKKRHRRYR